MFKWTQDLALDELSALLKDIPQLESERRFSAEHTRWLTRALRVLEQVFGTNSRYFLSLAHLSWGDSGTFLVQGRGGYEIQSAIERRHQEAYVRQLDTAKGFLLGAVDDLTRSGIENVYEGKNTPAESSAIMKVLTLVERKLRKAVRGTPDRERDIQDAFETLLVGADIPYARETDSIIYSSKTYTPDFSFEPIDLALELKFCNRPDREKQAIAEINDDILAYKTKYGNLIFAVYDVGHIRDVDAFSGTFEALEGVIVRVVKH
jgi:hypothetical protein